MNKISLPLIRRLPKYYRHISTLRQHGTATVSSSELASIMGTTASQVRQDFNCFGGFGQQGIGYNVEVLCFELEKLLFSGEELKAILIGTGKLGKAISQFLATEARGLNLIGAFDKAPEGLNVPLGKLTVQGVDLLAEFCAQHTPQIAVLCVPPESAQQLAPKLVELGITGFWNFSHYDLRFDDDSIEVENVHLSDSLMSLGYRLRSHS